MKIERQKRPKTEYREQADALRSVLATTRTDIGRPCPHCNLTCPQCESTICTCQCGPDCPDAPRALSSDPEQFPIEAGIVPLVYALKLSGIALPCWSCEGHIGLEGNVWKLPTVLFYSNYPVYPALIVQHLNRLQNQNQLTYFWMVRVEQTDNTCDITYSIMPVAEGGSHLDLKSLRNDMRKISDTLFDGVRREAHSQLLSLTPLIDP